MALTPRSKPKSYHRKLQGQHHRHNQRYLKTYWPYLPMLVIIVFGLVINAALTHSSQVLGAQTNFSSSSLLNLTNQDRQLDGESALDDNSQLSSAAQAKAEDMVANNYWSHISPSGKTPWSFISSSGYQYQAAGENLAYGFNSASNVMNAWMNSPEHRANILNPSYQDVGFGVAEATNFMGQGQKVIVVAEYGEPVGAAALNQPKLTLSAANSQPVSRLQLITKSKTDWSVVILSLLTAVVGATLIVRHSLKFKKLLLEGEDFVLKHPLLDILLVMLCTTSVLLTRTVGQIS